MSYDTTTKIKMFGYWNYKTIICYLVKRSFCIFIPLVSESARGVFFSKRVKSKGLARLYIDELVRVIKLYQLRQLCFLSTHVQQPWRTSVLQLTTRTSLREKHSVRTVNDHYYWVCTYCIVSLTTRVSGGKKINLYYYYISSKSSDSMRKE